jgi:uncharacterized protein with PIN domain
MRDARRRCLARDLGGGAALSGFERGPRYHADASLNRFVRWLRVLGLDATLETQEEEGSRVKRKRPEELFARAAGDGRVLLTTSVRLMERKECPPSAFFVDTKSHASGEEALVRLLRGHGALLKPDSFLSK